MEPHSAGRSAGSTLLLFFVLLSIFNVGAVVLCLFFSSRIESSYRSSVQSSDRWSREQEYIANLIKLAQLVAAPPDEVFASKDVEQEQRRSLRARVAFDARMGEILNGLRDLVGSAQAPAFLTLNQVSGLMDHLSMQSMFVFRDFKGGDLAAAGRHMAAVNRTYAIVIAQLLECQKQIQQMAQRDRDHNLAMTREIRAQEKLLVLLVGFLILCSSLYARRLSKRVVGIEVLEQNLTALRESQERFDRAARATQDVIWEWDLANERIWFSEQARELYSVEMSSDGWIDIKEAIRWMHPDDHISTKSSAVKAIRSTADSWEGAFRIVRTDGTTSQAVNRAQLVRDAAGRVVKMYGAISDITARENAARALRESEERFQLVARATHDVLWDWNLATNKVWVNNTFVQEYDAEAPGNIMDISAWSTVLHPDEAERVMGGLQDFLANDDDIWIGEYRIRRRDGSWADTYDSAYKVRGSDGAPVRMVGAMVDITARKQSELALLHANRDLIQLSRRTQSILNGAADAIIGTDRDRRITFVNPAAAKILGIDAEEMRGHALTAIVNANPFAPKGSTRGAATLEMTFFRDGGVAFPAEYLLSQILDETEEVAGFVLTFRDVTERQAVEKLKSEFVSVVSHELRTPLTSIRGALGLLEGGMLGEIPDRGRRMLEIAVTNTDRLVRLINDILDIERMESGNVTLSARRCNPAELIAQAVDVMRPMAEKARVSIEVDRAAGSIWADADRILQTLTNLLSNAIKFSPPESAIVISAVESSRKKVVFQIRDQGRGIPVDKLDAVFDRFHQVDASDSREKGGSGLGLAICRSIVRQHGGEIWVTSMPGEGSEFSFSIPAVETSDPAAPISGSTRALKRMRARRRILVCDDDASVREVLQTMLESHGFEVLAVPSGIELLEKVENFQPHSILLDVLMPYMDGWQTMAALRANPATADIPIVFVTVTDRAKSAGRQTAPEAWVQKPLEEASLLEALQGVLGMAERRPRVVLVEDDLDLARVVIASFQNQGIETFHAPDGKKALEIFEEIVPDLVVLDVVLPELDGYAVMARLRDRKEFHHVPVVVYSAEELTAGDRGRLTLGPTEFLTKSRITPAEFERRVIGMLSKVTDQGAGKERHVA
ncbi:MAG TPA: response regulator [Thermoanaerobaculia bacterium]|nr:response regulator [Thermoanaerobaculia bacterium]